MEELKTWAGRSSFKYSGSVDKGTKIYYGKDNLYSVYISPNKYSQLLNHFHGQVVNIGTSRTKPPAGSLGEWLMKNVTKTAVASYVGPIIINEGYAEKEEMGKPYIKITSRFKR